MNQGLPRTRILRGRGAFAQIIRTGASVNAGPVKLWYAPARSANLGRTGFAVSGKGRNAAIRNRLKRCLREAIRLHQDEFPPSNLDVILMYTGPAVKKAGMIHCKSLEQQVVSAMKRLMAKASTQ